MLQEESKEENQTEVLRLRPGGLDLPWQKEKERRIEEALYCDPVDLPALRDHAVSMGGLLSKHLRKKAWPKLVGVNVYHVPAYEGPSLTSHKERPQVLLDVNRCGKRIPSDVPDEERARIQGDLEHVILRVLVENPGLHYYQGLHDVALTFLPVMGKKLTFAIMNVLVKCHLRDFLDVDMGRTKVVIGMLSPLLALEDEELELFLTRSECAYYFSLSWLITWYGHVIQSARDAHRLADAFLASHPLFPVYVAAAIILTRRSEVLELDCDLSSVHFLLSKLPSDLRYEQMIMLAQQLFKKHPPDMVVRKKYSKLRSSSLVVNHAKFLRSTKNQRPDHILRHLPPPPPPSQWAWLGRLTSWQTLSVLASLLGPVFVAIIMYWVGNYWRTPALQ